METYAYCRQRAPALGVCGIPNAVEAPRLSQHRAIDRPFIGYLNGLAITREITRGGQR
jgi:hypothetical protein